MKRPIRSMENGIKNDIDLGREGVGVEQAA